MDTLMVLLGVLGVGCYWYAREAAATKRTNQIHTQTTSPAPPPLSIPAPLASAIKAHGLPVAQVSVAHVFDEMTADRVDLLRSMHKEGQARGFRVIEFLKQDVPELADREALCIIGIEDGRFVAFISSVN